jgi:hypothetical protein
MVTAAKNLVFDTTRNEKHHADKFWAWVLALTAALAVAAPEPRGVLVHDEAVSISPF